MELTIKFIETKFNEFNKEYFKGELITPIFKIIGAKSYLGQLSWKNKNKKRYDYVISVSNYFDRSEKDFCNTIIHEMIHLYIRQNNIKDTNKHHGKVFYSIADRINKYGWDISRTNDTIGCELTTKETVTYNMVAFIDRKGRYFLMRYNAKNRSNYVAKFIKYKYTGIIWFTSTDNKKYATFPECRTGINGLFITKGEYEEIEKIDQYKFAV